jgi:ElaB/YqjD/DUF883 family membrane-anchored ribosome-binding protein
MNAGAFAEKWEQIQDEVQEQWSRLTDADLKEIQGQMSRLVHLLQERYDYSRERVEQEVEGFLTKFDNGSKSADTLSKATDTISETMAGTSAKAREAAATLRETMGQASTQVRETADTVRNTAQDVPARARETVSAYPWQALVAALILGFIVGLLVRPDRWKAS